MSRKEWITIIVITIIFTFTLGMLAFGQEMEVRKSVHWTEVRDEGLRSHFQAMMPELAQNGCLAATGSAYNDPDDTNKIILVLRCTLTNEEKEIEKIKNK